MENGRWGPIICEHDVMSLYRSERTRVGVVECLATRTMSHACLLPNVEDLGRGEAPKKGERTKHDPPMGIVAMCEYDNCVSSGFTRRPYWWMSTTDFVLLYLNREAAATSYMNCSLFSSLDLWT